jgi:hypothetical protein
MKGKIAKLIEKMDREQARKKRKQHKLNRKGVTRNGLLIIESC